jgi:phage-related protein
MPTEVRRAVGYALFAAQQGEKHDAKMLKGFGDAPVLEVIARHDGDTFRAVYTVRFGDVIYVPHVFQKKSKCGIVTPKKELELIHKRLKLASRIDVLPARPGTQNRKCYSEVTTPTYACYTDQMACIGFKT